MSAPALLPAHRLALLLIEESFGPAVAQVAAAVLRAGGCTADQLARSLAPSPSSGAGGPGAQSSMMTSSSVPDVDVGFAPDVAFDAALIRRCLALLYTHGLCFERPIRVPVKRGKKGGEEATVQLHTVTRVHKLAVASVLQRIRFARLSAFIQARMSDAGGNDAANGADYAALVELLLVRGVLDQKSLYAHMNTHFRSASRLNKKKGAKLASNKDAFRLRTASVLAQLSQRGWVRAVDVSDELSEFAEPLRLRSHFKQAVRSSKGATALWMREAFPLQMDSAGASSAVPAAGAKRLADSSGGGGDDDAEFNLVAMMAPRERGGGGRGGRRPKTDGGAAVARGSVAKPATPAAQKSERVALDAAIANGTAMPVAAAAEFLSGKARDPNLFAARTIDVATLTTVYWRVDFTTILASMRNAECVAFVASTLNEQAGVALRVILDQFFSQTVPISELNDPGPVQFDLHDVVDAYRKVRYLEQGKTLSHADDDTSDVAPTTGAHKRAPDALGVDGAPPASKRRRVGDDGESADNSTDVFEELEGLMDLMSTGPNPCISHAPAGGPAYELRLDRVVRAMQYHLVDSIVVSKFGDTAGAIFRLLSRHADGPMDVKPIANAVLCEQKECREKLYRLLEGGFVSLQDVPRTSDHAPSRTFYLWYVDWNTTIAAAEQEYINTMWRLKQRQRRLRIDDAELIERRARLLQQNTQQLQDGAVVSRPTSQLTRAEREQLQRLDAAVSSLEWGVIHADEFLQTLQF